ncbi:MAG TPA: restriction endonuclease subunit S [Candidatus Acidoferrales bacterium]|nr:restriction endonuclease subunit S [Candidatus Acidoferrales bacterium]
MRTRVEVALATEDGDLPPGWSLETIGGLVGSEGVFIDGDWVESKDQDPDGDVRLIQLADIGDGEYRNRSARFLTRKKAIELGCTFLKKGDVLIARMPDPLGRACIFPGNPKSSVTVVDVAIVRSANGEFDHRWLMYFVNAPAFRVAVASMQSGSTRKRISRGNLAKIALPVPPLDQQKRIVAEIEKQFSRLDEAVANLKRVKANLKRYKAAVLKAAVEGRLVETEASIARREGRSYETGEQLLQRILEARRSQWKGRGKYKEPTAPDTTDLPELPEGWAWATWDQISNWVTYGFTRPMPHVEKGVPIVTAKHVIDGKIELNDTHKTPHQNYVELSDKDRPVPGDILITKDGTIGRAAVVPEHDGFCINQSVAVVWLRACPIHRQYLLAIIESQLVQRPVREKARGVAIRHLSITDFAKLPLPVSPINEQQRIVAEIDRRLSVLREIGGQADANLKRAERLRRAILRAAFTGGLAATNRISGDPELRGLFSRNA